MRFPPLFDFTKILWILIDKLVLLVLLNAYDNTMRNEAIVTYCQGASISQIFFNQRNTDTDISQRLQHNTKCRRKEAETISRHE